MVPLALGSSFSSGPTGDAKARDGMRAFGKTHADVVVQPATIVRLPGGDRVAEPVREFPGPRGAFDFVGHVAGEIRQIAGALGVARHDRRQRRADRLARALIVGEEEDPVADDWAAERAAPLVSLVVALLDIVVVVEVVVGVQPLVAPELEPGAAELVGAGLRDHVDQAAGVVAVLRVEHVRQQAELGNRIEVRDRRRAVAAPLFDTSAVHHEAVGVLALTADGHVAGGEVAGHAARRVGRVHGHHARLQSQQIDIASPVQRLRRHRLAVDDVAELGTGGLDVDAVGRHLDAVGDLADLQRDVEPQRGVRVQDDVDLAEVA